MRLYIAWKSIKDDSEDLNLDAMRQNRETQNNLHRANETVDRPDQNLLAQPRIYVDKNVDMKTIVWDAITIRGGNESIIQRTLKKCAKMKPSSAGLSYPSNGTR